MDEDERETGEIAGIEIIGFLGFDRWSDLPEFSILWQLPGQEPGALVDVLKQQERLRERAELVAQHR